MIYLYIFLHLPIGAVLTCDGFMCTNGKCVGLIDVCDNYNDCGDNSDEKNCFYSINPVEENIITEEQKQVKLTCLYEKNGTRVYLYWYRQYPDQAPQFLLLKGARDRSEDENIPNNHFGSTTSQVSTELIIKEPTLVDTALYYCALSVSPVIQRLVEAEQKLL